MNTRSQDVLAVVAEMADYWEASAHPDHKRFQFACNEVLESLALPGAVGTLVVYDPVTVDRQWLENADVALAMSNYQGETWSEYESPRWELRDALGLPCEKRATQPPAANPVEPKPKTFISYANGMICEMEELPQPVAKSQGVDDAMVKRAMDAFNCAAAGIDPLKPVADPSKGSWTHDLMRAALTAALAHKESK